MNYALYATRMEYHEWNVTINMLRNLFSTFTSACSYLLTLIVNSKKTDKVNVYDIIVFYTQIDTYWYSLYGCIIIFIEDFFALFWQVHSKLIDSIFKPRQWTNHINMWFISIDHDMVMRLHTNSNGTDQT